MCNCEKRVDALSEAMNIMGDKIIRTEKSVDEVSDLVCALETEVDDLKSSARIAAQNDD